LTEQIVTKFSQNVSCQVCENLPQETIVGNLGRTYIETILKIAHSLGPSLVLKSLFTSECRLSTKKKKPQIKEKKFYCKGGLRITIFSMKADLLHNIQNSDNK
jgi:hypothetical protein